MKKSQRLRNFYKKKSTNLKGTVSGEPIKGEMDKDLARLNKMKKDAKAFEKTLTAKKKRSQKQAEDSDGFLANLRKSLKGPKTDLSKRPKSKSKGPRIGADPSWALGKVGQKRLYRLAGGGMVTSKYYSAGGKVITGRD